MEQTTNYGLNKPGGSDYARVDALNVNMDAVDAALKDLEESKAEGAALAAHEADGVKHVSAAERTAWNAKADGTATSAHIANTNNPHGVTAAQVGAVAKTGDTMTGDLTIKKSALPSLNFGTDGAGTATIFKNASSSVEDGLHIKDVDTDGTYAALCIKKIKGLASCLSLSFNGTSYNVYHAGNKPTPADIGAARLICGSYIGTGTAGVSNPCSITFEAAPKLIYLLGSKKPNGVFTWYSLKDHSDSSGHYLWGIYMGALTTVYTENTGFLTDSTELGATSYGKKSSDGKTYYWYVDMASLSSSQQAYGPGLQCNVSGNTYYYAALC